MRNHNYFKQPRKLSVYPNLMEMEHINKPYHFNPMLSWHNQYSSLLHDLINH